MPASITQPLGISCPACGLSRSFRPGAAPSRFPRRCPGCGAELAAEGLLEPAPPDDAATEDFPYPGDPAPAATPRLLPAPAGWEAAALVAFAGLLAWSHLGRGALAAIVSGADLVFHEAGHAVFGLPGSRALAFLGGTLAQLAIPVAAAAAFALRRRTAPFAVALVWLAFNLVEVGAYAGDAVDRALPLLAADEGQHDWWNLLGMLGVREHARGIGAAIAGAGWTLWAGAPAWAAWRSVAARRAR